MDCFNEKYSLFPEYRVSITHPERNHKRTGNGASFIKDACTAGRAPAARRISGPSPRCAAQQTMLSLEKYFQRLRTLPLKIRLEDWFAAEGEISDGKSFLMEWEIR